jgi:quinol monooxygenase YgiN
MLVVTTTFVPRAEHSDSCKAGAYELTQKSQGHEGVIAYYWTLDEDTQNLHLIEVFEDQASMIGHVQRTGWSSLAWTSLGTLKDTKMFGDRPSPELLELLGGITAPKVYPSLESNAGRAESGR